MFEIPRFENRKAAGHELAEVIGRETIEDPVVLALPRGGVPVAFEIASFLEAPLDLLLVRKIGAPGYPEYAVGAVVDGNDPQTVVNEDALTQGGVSRQYVEEEAARQLHEIERRRKAYLGGRETIDLKGRNIILVDDGVATGATVKAGLKALRRIGVGSILLAVPVAPREVLAELERNVDRIVCLHVPRKLRSVGLHYADFEQTTDNEVTELLSRNRARPS
ncbi:phosphoribosyltransferase [Rhizobium binxianense]